MADAPYWGELPPPQVGRAHSLKREGGNSHLSVDTKMAGDRSSRQSNAPSQKRQDRYSSQTEAATVSTQSPFASPLASEFSGGLAPRPPSFTGAISEDQYNKDYLEKRRRRQQARDLENANAPSPVPPPAAPDAPRAPPPVSYKDPYSNGGSAVYQGPTRPRSGRRSSGPISPSSLGPEEYYRSHPQDERAAASKDDGLSRNPELDEAPQRIHRRSRRTRSEQIDNQPRKESLSQIDVLRRAEWAPDRSPLQRLELTLDSITKEEKRARVEEAELLARENEAGRGQERGNKNSVRFRNRPVAKDSENITAPEPRNISQGDLSRKPSTKPKDQPQESSSNQRDRQVEPGPSTSRNLDPGFEYQQKQEPGPIAPKPEQTTAQTTPQRGKSFRDRSKIPVPISSVKTTAAFGRLGCLGLFGLLRAG